MNKPASSTPARRPTQRLQGLINSGRLKSQALGRDGVVAQWEQAVRRLHSAGLLRADPSAGATLAYESALMGCLAVLATYDLKPGSGQGHHEAAFSGVEYTEDPGFADVIADSGRVRSARVKSMYDAEVASEDQYQEALQFARSFLARARANLLAWDPSLTLSTM